MEKETFEYIYSSEQQREIDEIRKKYIPQEEDKMERLRRLDQSAAKKGTIISITAGTLGMLIMGFGMCCCLEWGDTLMIPGVILGLLGIGVMCAAYPIYKRITEKERKRIAPEILALIEELQQ